MNKKIGTVTSRSTRSIQINFYCLGVRCRETVKVPPTPANIARWEKKLAKIAIEIEEGNFNYADYFPNSNKIKEFARQPGDAIQLKYYLDDWLNEMKKSSKSSTWEGYRKIIYGHWLNAIGEKSIGELKRKDIKDYLKSLTCSDKTKGNILSPLRLALDEAVEDELIEQNPLAGWKLKRTKGAAGVRKKPRPDPFDTKEMAEILKALGSEYAQMRNFFQFAFWTGLRTSELIALKWSDIDFFHKQVFVEKVMTQAADEEEEPKTEAGDRIVTLLDPALAALNAQKQWTQLKGEEIFQDPRYGEPFHGDQAIRKSFWVPALKKAKVRYRKPYQTRHTFASMLCMAGEDVRWVAEQMGHKDWSFTARTYARWIPNNAPDAGSKAVAAYGGNSDKDAHKA